MSASRLADHVSISVTLDRLRMFLKLIHKKEALGSEEHVPPSVVM